VSRTAEKRYDAVVVGARCAGSPLAARLAAAGRSVLLVDREPPPADTLSTHAMFPNTVARLHELGALKRLEAEHTLNPVEYAVTILGHEIDGPFTPVGGFDRMLSVTRPVLDQALLDVALEAGAETRFGAKVAGLLGAGSDDDPVRGVVLEDGEQIEAEWVFGADGRASTVAGALGLEKERIEVGGMGLMVGYWRGLPVTTEHFRLEVLADSALTCWPSEDDITMLILGVLPEETRGSAEQRQAKFIERLGDFSSWFDRGWLEGGEQLGGIRIAPESMLRGYFRQASGPGWALVGDSGHFKHPSTGQGISDAIEQAYFVSDALASGAGLDGYEAWRDERAREHYEWSFAYGRFPEAAGEPLFAGLAGDPEAGQAFRDSFSRLTRPRSDVFTGERLGRWFAPPAEVAAPAVEHTPAP
jgi:2-polyprenyl-6-methoxyphenol hydroxylase-like FAD-dependent oxidoreductase